jgi:hypothetical protein
MGFENDGCGIMTSPTLLGEDEKVINIGDFEITKSNDGFLCFSIPSGMVKDVDTYLSRKDAIKLHAWLGEWLNGMEVK